MPGHGLQPRATPELQTCLTSNIPRAARDLPSVGCPELPPAGPLFPACSPSAPSVTCQFHPNPSPARPCLSTCPATPSPALSPLLLTLSPSWLISGSRLSLAPPHHWWWSFQNLLLHLIPHPKGFKGPHPGGKATPTRRSLCPPWTVPGSVSSSPRLFPYPLIPCLLVRETPQNLKTTHSGRTPRTPLPQAPAGSVDRGVRRSMRAH